MTSIALKNGRIIQLPSELEPTDDTPHDIIIFTDGDTTFIVARENFDYAIVNKQEIKIHG